MIHIPLTVWVCVCVLVCARSMVASVCVDVCAFCVRPFVCVCVYLCVRDHMRASSADI